MAEAFQSTWRAPVVRLVIANRVQIVAAPALIAFQLTAHERQHFVKFFGGLNLRIHHNFHLGIYAARFLQEAKGKFGAQSERILAVHSAFRKSQLHALPHSLTVRNVRKVKRAGQENLRHVAGASRRSFLVFSGSVTHEQKWKTTASTASRCRVHATARIVRRAKICSGGNSRFTPIPPSTASDRNRRARNQASRHARTMNSKLLSRVHRRERYHQYAAEKTLFLPAAISIPAGSISASQATSVWPAEPELRH